MTANHAKKSQARKIAADTGKSYTSALRDVTEHSTTPGDAAAGAAFWTVGTSTIDDGPVVIGPRVSDGRTISAPPILIEGYSSNDRDAVDDLLRDRLSQARAASPNVKVVSVGHRRSADLGGYYTCSLDGLEVYRADERLAAEMLLDLLDSPAGDVHDLHAIVVVRLEPLDFYGDSGKMLADALVRVVSEGSNVGVQAICAIRRSARPEGVYDKIVSRSRAIRGVEPSRGMWSVYDPDLVVDESGLGGHNTFKGNAAS